VCCRLSAAWSVDCCGAVCCSVLQCVAVCRSVLQCVAMCYCGVLQCIVHSTRRSSLMLCCSVCFAEISQKFIRDQMYTDKWQ